MKSFTSMLAAAMLLGSSSASQLKNRMSSPARSAFAETSAGAVTAHNCQYSINRINDEANTNYTQIVNAGSVFTDANFPANSEMIRWNDYPGNDNMASYASYSQYLRLTSKVSKPTLFATNVDSFDIVQGQDSDCYWISATADVANTGRMKDVFLTQNINRAGI